MTTTPTTRPELQDIPTGAFIAGEWRTLPRTFVVDTPYDSSDLAHVADCGPDEAREAIEAAVTAFATWKTDNFRRADIIARWADLIDANTERMARVMALEMGKPFTEAKGEVGGGVGYIRYYADAARHIAGERVPSRFAHKRGMTTSEAIGVVYAVTPWNFPMSMIARKAGPALAAGCTVVLKPAEQSPLTALLLAELWAQAGGPAGTLQVLPTNDPAAFSAPFFDDVRVRKVAFTGSTDVGRLLFRQAAPTLKKVSLELGGHAPSIVFADADLDLAVRESVISKFRNAGQTCISSNRFYVHESIADAFADAFARAASALKVGDPLDPGTEIGPLVDEQGHAKVSAHVEDAVSRGATAIAGGRSHGGRFYPPTVLSGVQPGTRMLHEETFGPVAPIVTFRTDDEAVALANDSEYGLAAYLYTRDLARAFRVSEALEYGIVGVNDGGPIGAAAQAPFGGFKNSGMGKEGGHWGLDEYLQTKYVSFGL
ncbi:NAD-dependent succinate-semialdehyde dehydrogenase [Deinococcus aquiradiocola]|uniref:NAD-dependent succinate-semialdehyde dehydrogenase n=1 Tax=Deinococcus aquiradiocola TaxID=393059 RepID=A0A917UPJ6_9DEIO|nr:NAD-dependent succinate-semialdehyde dehydrogenase [Deinococcus aquiradiocola]GGJ73251.1 NAD-dependent succinate-semialdehyde dehydrogenase [Deinococcus aquiradiocola]